MRSVPDALSAPGRRELALAASHTPSPVLIPPVLRDFSERYPGMSVTLRTLSSETVVREVARGAVDAGIAPEVACARASRPLADHDRRGRGHRARRPARLGRGIGELGERVTALLLGPEGSSTRMITQRYLARAG
ncbi:MAG: LysR family transcriptional regulator substrate-binding protein [Solirubrobacterales bacterium]|nr:LysR family transcriptional regulator substrate-binding protein [Solirubrobacterales bacterium]